MFLGNTVLFFSSEIDNYGDDDHYGNGGNGEFDYASGADNYEADGDNDNDNDDDENDNNDDD